MDTTVLARSDASNTIVTVILATSLIKAMTATPVVQLRTDVRILQNLVVQQSPSKHQKFRRELSSERRHQC